MEEQVTEVEKDVIITNLLIHLVGHNRATIITCRFSNNGKVH